MQPAEIIRALSALAHDQRLAAYRLLVQAGPEGLPAGDIARAIDVPPSTMSFHLAQLSHSRLVSQRRQGRSIIYAADYETMRGLMGYLTENCCGGEDCLADAPLNADPCAGPNHVAERP